VHSFTITAYYTHYTKATVGVSSVVDRQLYHAVKLDNCKEMVKQMIILLDDMYIKDSLVYDKHSRELIGFTDLGDINFHLTKLEQCVTGGSQPLATTIMSFMVKGLFSDL